MTSRSTASIVLAAGRGSRMKGYRGSKALLPLEPGATPYEGRRPILLHILASLPPGPRLIVVHHRKEDVLAAVGGLDLHTCEQPVLNGTGGALLAARQFLDEQDAEDLIITMGDIPFVRPLTYAELTAALAEHSLVVLGFRPRSKGQYGVLDLRHGGVARIVEWKYWRSFPPARQNRLQICNAGIYAARRADLRPYLDVMAARPHRVRKEIDGRWRHVEEFFATDLVEIMAADGLSIGYRLAEDENEVMGIDDDAALARAQQLFAAAHRLPF